MTRNRAVGAISLLVAFVTILGLVSAARAITFAEIGNTGELLGLAEAAGTLPTLTQITGSIASSFDADLYAISLGTRGVFSATTVGTPGTLDDTQLFLFSASGIGIRANDDSVLRPDPWTVDVRAALPGTTLDAGLYFLGISSFDRDPASVGGLIFPTFPATGVFGPTGPGGGSPLASWLGSGGTGTYTIDVHLEPVPEPATLFLFGTALAAVGAASCRRHRKQG
jgi:hypothetical protein